jgi:hypothetical protein
MLIWNAETAANMKRVALHLVDATDGKTPETGEGAGQPQINLAFAGWVNSANTLVHQGNGWYYLELVNAERAVLGIHGVRYKSAATAEFQAVFQVVAFNPNDAVSMGMSALSVLVSSLVEPTAPLGATPTPVQLWAWQAALIRNLLTVDGTHIKIHNDAGVEVARFPISDNGTIFTRTKVQSPP